MTEHTYNSLMWEYQLNENNKVERIDLATAYKLNGVAHRANGPARQWIDGGTAWWLYGGMHRYYGPHTSWCDDWLIHGVVVK